MNIKKIYFKDKEVVFVSGNQRLPITDHVNTFISFSETKLSIKTDFNWFIKQNQCRRMLFVNDHEEAFPVFISEFELIEAAGGVIQQNRKTLFIFRNKTWDLPKGKIDAKETIKQAAIRECEEECGITGLKIGKQLQPTYHMYQLKGKFTIKKTYWFLMTCEGVQKLKPQKTEGITKLAWLGKSELKKVLANTYPSIMDVLRTISWLK